MDNREIAEILKKCSKLMELHDENVFKIRSFQNASYQLSKYAIPLSSLKVEQIAEIQGVGKSLASKISQIINTKTFDEFENLIAQTPNGVLEMLSVTGLGPKKVKILWKEAQIDSLEKLKTSCANNELVDIKGFGEALQDDILEYLDFKEKSKGKFYYANIESIVYEIENQLIEFFGNNNVVLVGDVRRKLDIVEKIQYIIKADAISDVENIIRGMAVLAKNNTISSPYVWRGNIIDTEIRVEIRTAKAEEFGNQIYIYSSSNEHLNLEIQNGKSIKSELLNNKFSTEDDIFKHLDIPVIVPEMREAIAEINIIKERKTISIIQNSDLKGCLHNHSKYSDGENTIEEMANACMSLGYEYFGISDHSQTANYANGLKIDRIIEQHKEIDELNKKYGDNFYVFKGIESDILADGSLDYPEEILKTFDFIVASVHANLKMDIHKATERLLKAIENPYTTILGHPTGRLLLRRKGYPIDYHKVIDACASNGVVLELNANPWRLDIDWRFIDYALTKGVMISINPDAHEIEGIKDMHFGVCVARKGGLSPEMCFNTKSLTEIKSYFQSRKR